MGDHSGPARLDVRSLSKSFGPNRALSDVSLRIGVGEIHGLVGPNGSGKSTLVKILSGYHRPDGSGQMLVDGTPVSFPLQPRDIRRHGIAVVHQTLGLIDDMTVAENIRVGRYADRGSLRRIRFAAQAEAARETLDRLGAAIDPRSLAGSLPPASRALVAIARAMQHEKDGGGLIIFDESTRSLPRDVLDSFYATLNRLARQGTSVLLVSHRLDEVLAVCDRVTVLRDGRLAAAGQPTAGLSEAELAQLLTGKMLDGIGQAQPYQQRPATVQVEGLTAAELHDVSFGVASGEIVGVTGLPGSGFDQLPYLLAGAQRADSGALVLDGRRIDLRRGSVRDAIAAGICLVPERRDRDGLALDRTVTENITLPRIRRSSARYLIRQGWQRRESATAIGMLDIRPPDPAAVVGSLSGGNRQKVALAKWLLDRPRLLVLHEPMQGVDVGARRDLVHALRQAAASGCSVIVATGEPDDLAVLCDRVLILAAGRIGAELHRPVTSDDIIAHTYAPRPAARPSSTSDPQPPDPPSPPDPQRLAGGPLHV
jgi:ribose transport system ATP-binding protein